MFRSIAIAKPQPFPKTLKLTEIRSYVFISVFVLLSVGTPWVFHQFHLAGPTFLPMHIFILTAGLLFGWQAGVLIGLLTPLVSHIVSGMPALPVLPQIVVELSVYGLAAGMLREKFGLRPVWSLLGAMAAGRFALYLGVLAIYLIAGRVYSPLGPEANPVLAVWAVVKLGWPGIVIQLAFIPVLVWLLGKLTAKAS